MKKAFLAVSVVAVLAMQAVAANRYWDINQDTPGAGGASPGGAITGSNWTLDPTGSTPGTTTLPTTDTAVFSAGNDATGSFTITGSQAIGGLTIEEGRVVLQGSTPAAILTLPATGGTINIHSGATLSIANQTQLPLTAGVTNTVNLSGTIEQSNAGPNGTFFDVDSNIVLGAAVTGGGNGTFSYTTGGQLIIIQNTGGNPMTISGPGAFVKEGAGAIALGNLPANNTWTGGTIINNGDLRMRTNANELPITTALQINNSGIFTLSNLATQVGSLNSSSTTTSIVTSGTSGRLTVSGSAASSFAGVMSGAGGLTKGGTSTLALTNANTYTNTTIINGGTVAANNTTGSATGTGAITINNGGTLAGTGAVSGAVTVNSGGKVGAGDNNIQSLSVGNLSFASGSTFVAQLDSSASLSAAADLLQAGTLTITAGALLDLSDIPGSVALPLTTKLTLMSYTAGSWNNVIFNGVPDDTEITIGANTFRFDYNDTLAGDSFGGEALAGRSYITLTAVPEPTAFVIGGLSCGLVGLGYIRRKYVARRAAITA